MNSINSALKNSVLTITEPMVNTTHLPTELLYVELNSHDYHYYLTIITEPMVYNIF